MAQKKPKKMKWWKNSSLLFTGAVLVIPLAIFAVTVGMVVKRSASVHPSATFSSPPAAVDNVQFALDAYAYVKQGETIALYGLSHTQNVALNSAAGRLQKGLSKPKAELEKWLNNIKLPLSAAQPNQLTLQGGLVAQLNATSDRQMAGVMKDFASHLGKDKSYNLVGPKLIEVRKQLDAAAAALSHDVNSVLIGN